MEYREVSSHQYNAINTLQIKAILGYTPQTVCCSPVAHSVGCYCLAEAYWIPSSSPGGGASQGWSRELHSWEKNNPHCSNEDHE